MCQAVEMVRADGLVLLASAECRRSDVEEFAGYGGTDTTSVGYSEGSQAYVIVVLVFA